MGVAVFHLNRPKQTVLDDPNKYLAMRKVVHANFETYLNDNILLNTNGIYQEQSKASYFSVGGALGIFLNESGEDQILLYGRLVLVKKRHYSLCWTSIQKHAIWFNL